MQRADRGTIFNIADPDSWNSLHIEDSEHGLVVLEADSCPCRSPNSHQIIITSEAFCAWHRKTKEAYVTINSSVSEHKNRREMSAAGGVVRLIEEIT